MPSALDFFAHHSYLIVFVWVLVEQLGVPVPSIPVLLGAGSLAETRNQSLAMVVVAAVSACLISDSIWYMLGRRFGGPVLRLLCRLAMEISSCVRRTEERFTKFGAPVLLVAKFVPGLNTAAAPIAGQTRMRYTTFLALDLTGALVWSSLIVLAGSLFGNVLMLHPELLARAERSAGILVLLAVLGFVVYRAIRWQVFLRHVRTVRVAPEELKRMMDTGQPLFVVDLRHPLDLVSDSHIIPGALRISPDLLVDEAGKIPRDTDIVLYCSCPSEATAARTAMQLRRLGIVRVRPLLGGFDGWRKLGFPLEQHEENSIGK